MLFTDLLVLTSPPSALAQQFFFNYNVGNVQHPRQIHNISSPTVGLGYATYRGTRLKAGVDEYLGIRYAQPPLGDLRFRAPRDPLPERSPQNANKVGSQFQGEVDNYVSIRTSSSQYSSSALSALA